jgi:hypothetical protein
MTNTSAIINAWRSSSGSAVDAAANEFVEWRTRSRFLVNERPETISITTASIAASVQSKRLDPPTLLSLPLELHLKIISYIGPREDASYLHLRLTNQYFYHALPAPNHEDLLHIETTCFAHRRRLFACRYCLRLRKSVMFSDIVKRCPAVYRFCVDCGFDHWTAKSGPHYAPGTYIQTKSDMYLYRCRVCDKTRYMRDHNHGCSTCPDCHKSGPCYYLQNDEPCDYNLHRFAREK